MIKDIQYMYSRHFWAGIVLLYLFVFDLYETISIYAITKDVPIEKRDLIIEKGDPFFGFWYPDPERGFFLFSIFFSEIFFIMAIFILVLIVSLVRIAPETIALLVLAISVIELYLVVLKFDWIDCLKSNVFFNCLTENTLIITCEIVIFTFLSFLFFLNLFLIKRAEKGYLSEAVQLLMLFSVAGMVFFLSASDFIVLYLAMELISLCFYVLAASDRNNIKSVEAGIKYFILGSFSSSLFLLGVSFIYCFFGTIDFNILQILLLDLDNGEISSLLFIAFCSFLLILSAILFKLSVAPFHFWTPDVYEGAPFLILMFLSTIGKIPFFAFLLQFCMEFLVNFFEYMEPLITFVCFCSLFIGSLGALGQQSIKRFLGYMTIANFGFILLFLKQLSALALVGIFFYFFTYMILLFTLLAIFFVTREVIQMKYKFSFIDNISLYYTNNFFGLAFTVILLSMAGLPPFPMFFAKFLLINTLLSAQASWAILGLIVVSSLNFYVYLRFIAVIFFAPSSLMRSYSYHLITRAPRSVIIVVFMFLLFNIFSLFFFIEYFKLFFFYLVLQLLLICV